MLWRRLSIPIHRCRCWRVRRSPTSRYRCCRLAHSSLMCSWHWRRYSWLLFLLFERTPSASLSLNRACRRLRSLHTRIRRERLLLWLLDTFHSLEIRMLYLTPPRAQNPIRLERLPKHALALSLSRSGSTSWRCITLLRWRRMPAHRLKALVQHFNKIAREHANRSGITSQSAHPPQSIACIQRFDQVPFNES